MDTNNTTTTTQTQQRPTLADRARAAAGMGFSIGVGFFAAVMAVGFGLLLVSLVFRLLGWIVVPGA